MRIAAIESELGKRPLADLERLVDALETACRFLPEQLIQELGLRTLECVVRFTMVKVKRGTENVEAVGKRA